MCPRAAAPGSTTDDAKTSTPGTCRGVGCRIGGHSHVDWRVVMDAQAGDTIVVDARQTGQLPREGETLEVIERTGSVCYRVRWVNAHESIYFPATDAHIVARKRPRAPQEH